MTTIAYRDGIMAADTLVTGNDIRRGYVLKIGRLKCGGIFGYAGITGMLDLLGQWIDGGHQRADFPKLADDEKIGGICAFADGRVAEFFTGGFFQALEGEIFATGSGNEVALGAMAMGASARQAVEIAAKFDIYTGGRIVTLALSPSRPDAQDKPMHELVRSVWDKSGARP